MEAETTNETVTEEASKQDQAIKEETVATSDAAQDAVSEASGTTADPISQGVAAGANQQPSTTTSEPAHHYDAVSESSGTTSAPLGQSEAQPHSATEQAADALKDVQNTVSEKSSEATESVKQSIPKSTYQATEAAKEAQSTVSQKASELAESTKQSIPQQAQEYVSNATEQAQDALSSVSQTAQNVVSGARDRAMNFSHTNPREGSDKSRILYIGNLFFEVTAPQLEQEMARFGEVTNSRIVTDNRGLSKGFGYIQFARQEAADAAVESMNQKVFQGRRMAVQYHKRKERVREPIAPKPPSKTLFIGNMSYQMSDRDLNGRPRTNV